VVGSDRDHHHARGTVRGSRHCLVLAMAGVVDSLVRSTRRVAGAGRARHGRPRRLWSACSIRRTAATAGGERSRMAWCPQRHSHRSTC
jgi:hypothetical protein